VALCWSEVAQRSSAIDAVAATVKDLVRKLIANKSWYGAALIGTAAELSASPLPP
jgi:hypothetical protein